MIPYPLFYINRVFISIMSPRPAKYDEKGKLRVVKCKNCGHEYATSMKIPRCSKCGKYAN